jgi:hypothetical protein
MSSIQSILQIILQNHGAELAAAGWVLQAPSAKSEAKPTSEAKPKKMKKASKEVSSDSEAPKAKKSNAGQPSAWMGWVALVSGKGKEETPAFAAWKTQQVDASGNLRTSFAKAQKEARTEDYTSFVASFKIEHPLPAPSNAAASNAAASSASSVVSDASSGKKKAGRKPDTPEVKAAKAAKKAAEKAAASAMKAAEVPLPPSPEGEEEDMEVIRIDGTLYYLDSKSNILYKDDDGTPGEPAGRLNEDGDGLIVF